MSKRNYVDIKEEKGDYEKLLKVYDKKNGSSWETKLLLKKLKVLEQHIGFPKSNINLHFIYQNIYKITSSMIALSLYH